jgi:hypothetical protein
MNDVETYNSFKEGLVNNIDFKEYCEKGVYNIEQLKDDLYWLIKELGTKTDTPFKVAVMIKKEMLTLKIELKAKMLSINYKIEQLGLEDTVNGLIEELQLIIKGTKAIDVLNQVIFDEQQNGTDTFVKFKFGLTKYCRIGKEWNYDRMVIQLSRTAVTNLISLDETSNLEETITKYLGNDWDTSASKLITKFNCLQLCERIGARLETNSIEKELLRDSICEKDVFDLIQNCKKEKSKECYQIEYYDIIDALGHYLVKVVCDVDFSAKEVTTKVIGKIYDIVDDNFIKFVKGETLTEKICHSKENVGKEWQEYIRS